MSKVVKLRSKLKLRTRVTRILNMRKVVKLRSKLKLRTRVKRILTISSSTERPEQPPVGPSEVQVRLLKQARENTVLLISHKTRQCGIYQYGLNITEALQRSSRYLFAYAECSSAEELGQAISQVHPSVIIYNHYPFTMPWLTSRVTRRYKVPQIGIMHE